MTRPVVLLWMLCAVAAGAADLDRRTFRVPTGPRFTLEFPTGWTSELQTNSGLSMATFRLSNQETSSVLMVSIIPSGSNAEVDSMSDQESILVNGTKPMARDSVEKAVQTQSFRSAYAYGLYATFTDARLVARTPLLGEFRNATTFILNCDHHTVTATFVTNEETGPSVDLAVMILKTLRREEDTPTLGDADTKR